MCCFARNILLIYVVIVVVNKTPFISLDSLDFLSPFGRTIVSWRLRHRMLLFVLLIIIVFIVDTYIPLALAVLLRAQCVVGLCCLGCCK